MSILSKWKKYKAIMGELEILTDQELWDIGILRANIKRVAQQQVYGS